MKDFHKSRFSLGLVLTLFAATRIPAAFAEVRWDDSALRQDSDWYASAEARLAADTLLLYQSSLGAWPKNTDLFKSVPPGELARIRAGSEANTIDNGATTTPMRFLARVIQATNETKYKESFTRGLDYLFQAQYPNGGWPQFYPLRTGYYSHITFNDGAMMNVVNLLRDAADGKAPYEFVDQDHRAKASAAVAKGIDCILRTQLKEDGQLTVWCAQYDEETMEPAWARNFEPPSLSGDESVDIVRFLMREQHPTPAIIASVEGAVAWFKAAAIPGLSYERGMAADGKRDGKVTADPNAGLIWARFYELGSNRPLFVGRAKEFNYSYDKLERERRGGYDYYGAWPATLLTKDYPAWCAKRNVPTVKAEPVAKNNS